MDCSSTRVIEGVSHGQYVLVEVCDDVEEVVTTIKDVVQTQGESPNNQSGTVGSNAGNQAGSVGPISNDHTGRNNILLVIFIFVNM